ncbi:uncharacterized protein LOC112216969 isoform X2 [Oncorhynchus tshawytscha]|uniref:uncharacterized protein LOC112216969 isoform X2 n=1 Tax=Oncorhynchus tshawytscha TaxID=74940 RepID=UPI000D09BA46|nr:uncharacterized protein LOC112216969 isoform X2 [Oncorhynchus tshawytscha]
MASIFEPCNLFTVAMIQPVLLLLLLAARFSPVFGTEISVLEGTSVTLVCRFPSEKNYILYTTLSETSPCKRWSCCNPIAVTTIPTITQENKYRCITGVEMVNFTILNLQPADSGNYCCSAAISTGLNKPSEFYSLRVVKGHTGCNRDLLDGLEFLGNDIENHPITIQSASQCRQECTNIDKCQYFTFSWEETEMRNKCSLKASTGDLLNSRITIQRLQNATSGYSLKNCSGKDYLHYINKSKSWINAMEFCRSRGSKSNLVHITNQTVHVDVTQLIANVELACGGVWIGLERSIFEWNAPWLWTSGDVDKVVKYSEWHSCFPLNPINYHCGKMVRVGNGELKWLDASCHQELPFICQDVLTDLH